MARSSSAPDLFGPQPAADVVFAPQLVGPNAAAMKSALDTKIQSDNGSTDYNAAFNTGWAANPGAKARIFLTDGAHNQGNYNNTHLNPTGPQTPTYVIGFSSGLASPTDQARLQKIATATCGTFFPLADSSDLQSVTRLVKGKLRFTVKAAKIGSGAPKVKLTTQVSQTRRR